MFKLKLFGIVVGVLLGGQLALHAVDNPQPPPPAPQAAMGEYNLADFGPVKTSAEAQATLQAAMTNIICLLYTSPSPRD